MKHIFETAIAIGCTIVIVSVGIAAATHRISISRAESIIEKTAGVRRNPAQLIEAAGKTGSVVKRAIEKPSQGKSTAERIKSVTKELGDELLNSSSSKATMPLIPASTSPSLLYKQKPLIFGHRNLNLSLENGQNSREVLEPTLSQMVSQDQAADALERLSGVEPTYGQKGASTDFTCSSFDYWTAFGLDASTGTSLKGRFLRCKAPLEPSCCRCPAAHKQQTRY